MHIFCLSYWLILLTLNKSYCVTRCRILPVSVFCVLQGSGVTPLKCGKIYDMDFVANFMENMTVNNICQTYERMCSGTVFIETRCSYCCYWCYCTGLFLLCLCFTSAILYFIQSSTRAVKQNKPLIVWFIPSFLRVFRHSSIHRLTNWLKSVNCVSRSVSVFRLILPL